MGDSMIYTHIAGVYVAFIVSLLICCAIAYILGLFWFSDKRNRQFNSFFLLGIQIFFWTLLNAVSMVCQNEFFPVIYTLRMVAVCIVPFGVAWFLFHFVNSSYYKKWVRNLFIVIAAVDILFVLTNPLHHFYFADYILPIPTRAPAFWIHIAVNFLIISIAVIISLYHMFKEAKYKNHLILAAVGMLIPYAINLLWNFGVIPFTYDITPIGFFITFILFVFAAFRGGLLTQNYELEAVQRTVTAIFESNPHMNVMFDSSFKVLDCNPAACRYMGVQTKEELITGFAEWMTNSIPALQSNGKRSRSVAEVLVTAAKDGHLKNEIELVINGKIRTIALEIKRIPYGDSFALLGYMTDLTDTEKLVRREKMLSALNEMAITLLSHENEPFDVVMNRGLKPITETAGAHRVAVYKLVEGEKQLGQVFLWHGKILPLEDELVLVPLDPPVLRWLEVLQKNECINANCKEIPEDEAAWLAQFGVKSIFFVPIYTHGTFWGVITLEDQVNYRYFDEDCLDLLRSAANLCADAVVRREMETTISTLDMARRTMTAIFESNPQMNVMFDDKFRIINCNPAAINLMGFNTKEDFISGFAELITDSLPPLQPDGKPTLSMA
jgi:PAS domain-containing protein